MYVYRARVVAVYDADTITVDVDLGFHAWLRKVKVRLHGINAPEMRGPERPEGIVARDWLRREILGKDIVMRTYKAGTGKGKYGRWLGEVFRAEDDPVSLNQDLVNNGLAVPASY